MMASYRERLNKGLVLLTLLLATTPHSLAKPVVIDMGAEHPDVPVDEIEFITDQVTEVVLSWWPMVANGQTIISFTELDTFFKRYIPGAPDTLLLFEEDFIGGDQSWTKDFEEHHMTEEYSSAYFRSLDVILESSVLLSIRLTWLDVDEMIHICEQHAGEGGSASGYLNEAEFTAGFEEVILRSVSFSLLFIRFHNTSVPGHRYENLNLEEFFEIFHAMDEEDNNIVSSEEFGRFWEKGKYGPDSMAQELFDKLDVESNGHLSLQEWHDLFDHLNCRDGGEFGGVDIEEFFQLDLILHDLSDYPSDDCVLDRIPGMADPEETSSE